MRKIAVVTVGRSDYGIYRSLLESLQGADDLELQLIVAGAHLLPEFGLTVRQIEEDGFPIAGRIEMLVDSDTPLGMARSMGLGVAGFAACYRRCEPDLLVVLGDRFEMHAAALAALPLRLPVAHVHGGELTRGAMDDALRHSMTKLSHLHFVATEAFRDRVLQLGEEAWRVTLCGAPGLDALDGFQPLAAPDLESRFGFDLSSSPLLITYHSETLGGDPRQQIAAILSALGEMPHPLIFTQPNPDPGGRIIEDEIARFVATRESAWLVPNLGSEGYWSMLSLSLAMVGNSSSGLIEAPSFGLPVVNIGSRQDGRPRAANVLDVACEATAIADTIRTATGADFRRRARACTNPYRSGRAGATITEVLRRAQLGPEMTAKRFVDLEGRTPA